MKLELVVIAGQQTAVNTFSGLVQFKLRLPVQISSPDVTSGLGKGKLPKAKWHPPRVTKEREGLK